MFREQLSVLFASTVREYIQNFVTTPRGELYTGMVRILHVKPFFGEGPGTFAGLVSKLTISQIPFKYGLTEQAIQYSSDAYPAHVLGELGIIGGILYSIFLINVYRKLSEIHKRFIEYGNEFYTSVAIYLKTVFVIGLFELLVSSFFEVTIKTFAFFGVFAIVVSIDRKLRLDASNNSS